MLTNLIRVIFSRVFPGKSASSSCVKFVPRAAQHSLEEAVALHRSGQLLKAAELYEDILVRHPESADALHLLAIIEHRRGNLDRAEILVNRAISRIPDSVDYLNTLASILSDLGRIDSAVATLRAALRIDPTALRPRSNLLFVLNLLPNAGRKEVFDEHLTWAKLHADLLGRKFGRTEKNIQSRKLRIGYVSGDFRSHPVGRIMSAVLSAHDRESLEVFCYDNTSERDELTHTLRGYSDKWIEIDGLGDEGAFEAIERDEIDVLIDLSGHTHGSRLLVFARKPAPVQVSWLGYLNTTGMRQIDWRITTARNDPEPDAQSFHTERIWYLPDCLWLPDESAAKEEVPTLRGSPAESLIFGSFNTFRKVNIGVVRVWAKILAAVPGSILRMHGVPRGRTLDLLLDEFQSCGVGAERVEFMGVMDHARFQSAYGDVDIALDPFPYSGGATTCECLWMGVPVIAMGGSGGFSRNSAAILESVGLPELVARSQNEYKDIAIRLSGDRRKLAEYRGSIRQQMKSSPLLDARRFVEALETAYETLWDDWKLAVADKDSVA
jgi:protein O-GlcNAc transferase